MTSNNGLRGHIAKHHAKEYVDKCKANGWQIQIKSLRTKEVQTRIDGHMSVKQKKPQRPKFSSEAFLQSLTDFIVADDQV